MRKQDRERLPPVRRPAELDQYEGLWVAVKDDKVVAVAGTSVELVPAVKDLGDAGRGAVAKFIPHRTEQIVIGVG